MTQALAICSEFSDEYGVDSKDKDKIVVRMKSKYINELKNMLKNKNFKLKSFDTYGDEALVYFVSQKKNKNPNNKN